MASIAREMKANMKKTYKKTTNELGTLGSK